jgi:hypothetical protein
MDPVTAGLIAVGVGGGLIKAFGGLFDDTAEKKANLMRKEADLSKSALEENMRRTEGQQTQVLSSTKARLAATGFDSDSNSFTQLLSGMSSEFDKQNAFARKQGEASIDLQRQAADITGDVGTSKWLNFGADVLGTAGDIFKISKFG